MSNQEKLEVFEITLVCQNPSGECNNVHHEVTSDIFASVYNITCAKCGYGGFKIVESKALIGGSGPTKFSFEE